MGEAEDGHGFEGKLDHSALLTDPDQAVDFVQRTGVDALAIAMGTSHGAYKFTRKPDGDVLAMKVIEEIHHRLPNTHLVMHGSSSVPQELQDLINAYGGKMPQTWGVPVEEIQRGIKHGVRKINIDTDNRMAITGAIRKGAARKARRVRSPRLSEARQGSDETGCEGAVHRVRRGGQGVPDPPDPHFADGETLRIGRAGAQDRHERQSCGGIVIRRISAR